MNEIQTTAVQILAMLKDQQEDLNQSIKKMEEFIELLKIK